MISGRDFLIQYINNLELEIKRLKKENDNTIKLTINYDGSFYEIDTQIQRKYNDGDILYLADNNQEPTKVKVMKHRINNTINADWLLYIEVLNLNNQKFEYYEPRNLFKSKKDAIEKYYHNKFGPLYKESPSTEK